MTDHCDHCHSSFTDPKTIVTHPFTCVLALEVNGNRNNPVFEEMKISCEGGVCMHCGKKFPTGNGNQLNHLLKSCNVKFPNKKKVRKVASSSVPSSVASSSVPSSVASSSVPSSVASSSVPSSVASSSVPSSVASSSDNPAVSSIITGFREQHTLDKAIIKDLQAQLFLANKELTDTKAELQVYRDLPSIADDRKRIFAHEELKVAFAQVKDEKRQCLLANESLKKVSSARLRETIILKKQLDTTLLIITEPFVARMTQVDLDSLEDLTADGIVIVESIDDMDKRFRSIANEYYHPSVVEPEEPIVDDEDKILDLNARNQLGRHMGLDPDLFNTKGEAFRLRSSIRAGLTDKQIDELDKATEERNKREDEAEVKRYNAEMRQCKVSQAKAETKSMKLKKVASLSPSEEEYISSCESDDESNP